MIMMIFVIKNIKLKDSGLDFLHAPNTSLQ
jgi:hypothetical protein